MSFIRRNLFFFFFLLPLAAPASVVETLPPMREQHAIRQEWVRERLVAEWNGQPVSMMQEEDAAIAADGTISFVLPRQARLHLVK